MKGGTDTLLARVEIEALIAEFAFLIDNGMSDKVADLFTEDGWYGRQDGKRSQGREAIRQAYASRSARGERVARHLFTNLRLSEITTESAEGRSILLLFAADGAPPHPAVPLLVQDYVDTFRKVDGTWLFSSRLTVPLFVSPDFETVLPLGENRK